MKVTKKWGDFADGTKIFAGVAEWALGVDNIDKADLIADLKQALED